MSDTKTDPLPVPPSLDPLAPAVPPVVSEKPGEMVSIQVEEEAPMVQPVMKHRPDADDRARAKQKDPYDIAHIRDKIEKQLDAVNAVKGQIAEAEKKAGITE